MPQPSPTPRSAAAQEFGRRVRQVREERGLSQEALADRSGVHWTFVGQVERGQRSIRLDNIVRLAHGLEVRPGRLMDELPVELI